MVDEAVSVAISTIVTHVSPHIDEICAIWLLRRYGRSQFIGIEAAPVIFWSEGTTAIMKSPEEFLAEGVLLVGVGGGMFDEHSTVDSERKSGKCSATLVAEHLGIDDDPALEFILDFVERNDLNGSGSMFDIASICRKMYTMMPAEKVINWATLALEAFYREQAKFAQQAVSEYHGARVFNVPNGANHTMKVVVIQSDNDMVAKFARAARGGNAALVIQKQSSGNVQIFSNRKYKVNMNKIAHFIRLAEQKKKGKIFTFNSEDLERDGSVRGAEEWHFFKKGQMLLNGSTSHPDVPPTNLPLEEITKIVRNCVF